MSRIRRNASLKCILLLLIVLVSCGPQIKLGNCETTVSSHLKRYYYKPTVKLSVNGDIATVLLSYDHLPLMDSTTHYIMALQAWSEFKSCGGEYSKFRVLNEAEGRMISDYSYEFQTDIILSDDQREFIHLSDTILSVVDSSDIIKYDYLVSYLLDKEEFESLRKTDGTLNFWQLCEAIILCHNRESSSCRSLYRTFMEDFKYMNSYPQNPSNELPAKFLLEYLM